jgi:predicted short-subunit dehydrogenase-like oxidoreductase (DUF2520 family)
MGRLLYERGFPVTCVASRDPVQARAAAAFIGGGVQAVAYSELAQHASRILIAVPDSALAEVINVIAASGFHEGIALHTCGTQSAQTLHQLMEQGVACGTIHPLQTITDPLQGATVLLGCAFAVDGDAPAILWAREIAARLDGEVLRIAQELRPLYHAGAVMASNYVAGLVDAAQHLMEMAGVERETSLRALAPLLRATLENVLQRGPVAALTGPIQRGDSETIEAHLRALRTAPESIRQLYQTAGLHVTGMARTRGLSAKAASRVEQLLQAN